MKIEHQAFTQNKKGQCVPCIPEPYYLIFKRVRCICGKKFKNKRRYREHYALVHIVE